MSPPMVKSLVLATTTLWCFAGCGGPKYELAPVSGIVTLDGEPLVNGVVNFQPKVQKGMPNAPGSVGRTDATGRFHLITIHDEPGASPGRHKVKIYSYSPETPLETDEDTGPSVERVPERYNYATRLLFEVPNEGTEQANFDLTTDP